MDRDKVLNLAKLARIEIGDEEARDLMREFDAILAYVGEVKSAEISSSVLDSKNETLINVMRDDTKPHESGIYSKKILEQSPAREGDYIKVKKIL